MKTHRCAYVAVCMCAHHFNPSHFDPSCCRLTLFFSIWREKNCCSYNCKITVLGMLLCEGYILGKITWLYIFPTCCSQQLSCFFTNIKNSWFVGPHVVIQVHWSLPCWVVRAGGGVLLLFSFVYLHEVTREQTDCIVFCGLNPREHAENFSGAKYVWRLFFLTVTAPPPALNLLPLMKP